MNPARSLMRLSLLAALLSPWGCGEDPVGPAVGSCQSSSQCSVRQICRLPEGVCVAEPENSFVGKFQCNLVPDQTPIEQAGVGSSEVSGNLEGVSYPLLTGASCALRETTLSSGKIKRTFDLAVYGFLTGVSKNTTLSIHLNADEVKTAGRQDLYQADSPHMNSGATLLFYDPAEEKNVSMGFSSHGYLLLDQAPEVGKPLSGYIAVKMHAVSGKVRVGNLCPRGAADCGASSTKDIVFCLPLEISGQETRICTTFCEEDGHCAPYGGACLVGSGMCLTPCSSSGNCSEGTECSLVSEDPSIPRFCLP